MLHRGGRSEPWFSMLWKQTVTVAQAITEHRLAFQAVQAFLFQDFFKFTHKSS